MLHGHGDDSYRYKNKIIADFSSNVWHGGEPKGLKAHLFSRWEVINKYPEVLAESLASQIASHHQLLSDQILISSGTTESIYLIAQAFRGKTTTIAIPAFSEYEDACRMHNHQLIFLDWEKLADFPKIKTNLVFICNPNNPTGRTFDNLKLLLTENPEALFIVDEAFIEFTLSIASVAKLMNDHRNLLVLRSLTKAYAIPGLRLGYIVGNKAIISQLRNTKAPWTVNSLAIEAGKFLFNHYEDVQIPLNKLLNERDILIEKLQENHFLKVYSTHTHFFLAETICRSAAELKMYLIERHGILIRDASNFRGLGARHFRIATLSPEKNKILIEALQEWK